LLFSLTCCGLCEWVFSVRGEERRFDDGVWCVFSCRVVYLVRSPSPFSWNTKKVVIVRNENRVSSSGVFFFSRTIFSVKNFIALKLIFDFLFLFFTAWFWGTGHEQRRCTQPPIQSRR
jgi:hypothetical protein